MNAPDLDRREHRRFRILYLDFGTFWKRYVLHEKAPRISPASEKAPEPHLMPSAEDHHGKVASSASRKLDEQHHDIRADILNFQKDLRNGLAEQPLAERLDLLLQKMNVHFHFEESCLSHLGFAGLESHRAEHDQFRSTLIRLRERAASGDRAVSLECSTFLFNWLSNHAFPEDATSTKHPPPH